MADFQGVLIVFVYILGMIRKGNCYDNAVTESFFP